MACSDDEFFGWRVPHGSVYRLTITGPPGQFTASVMHKPRGLPPVSLLPIVVVPGRHEYELRVVTDEIVQADIRTVTPDTRFRAEATVAEPGYCREVAAGMDFHEQIMHFLKVDR